MTSRRTTGSYPNILYKKPNPKSTKHHDDIIYQYQPLQNEMEMEVIDEECEQQDQ